MSLSEETSTSVEQIETTTVSEAVEETPTSSEEISSEVEATSVEETTEEASAIEATSVEETTEEASAVEANTVSETAEETAEVEDTSVEETTEEASAVEANTVSETAEETFAATEETLEVIDTPRESLAKKIWGIGVRHVVFMALGAALYAGLSYVTNALQLPGASNVSLRPGIVIPLFFGSVFGPWVGLFTGFVGNSINDLLQGGFWWNWELGAGLIGFIPGLVLYFTRGRYNNALRIILAEIFSVIGLLVGLAFASITDIWVSGLSFTTAMTTEFFPAFLPDLVLGVVLLAILLVAYNAALGRSGRS